MLYDLYLGYVGPMLVHMHWRGFEPLWLVSINGVSELFSKLLIRPSEKQVIHDGTRHLTTLNKSETGNGFRVGQKTQVFLSYQTSFGFCPC
jgi:hypothetical protein